MKPCLRTATALLAILLGLAGCDSARPAAQSALPATPLPIASPAGASAQAVTAAPTVAPVPTIKPTPSPEPELLYAFNPYALPSDAKAYLGDKMQDYKLLVDALMQHKEKVLLGKGAASAALSCLYAEFPLSVLLSDYTIDQKGTTVSLRYVYDAAEHEACIQAFQTRVEAVIRSTAKPSYNDCERALALYRWTAQNITYTDGNDVTPYHALMDGHGICQSYAGVYRFLLLQMDMDSLSGSAFMTNDTAHEWNIVRLDNAWFHMDTTFENGTTQGAGLQYFGMTDAQRLQSGALDPITTGINDWCAPAPSCENPCFEDLSACTRWQIDSANHRVLLYTEESLQPYGSFDTVAYRLVAEP